MNERFSFAQALAREAGALAHRLFTERDALVVESKGPQDWVSRADREVEDLIRARIAEAFPQDGFLGEESGTAAPAAGGEGTVWVVDPIDGTACFLAGIPTWCISIALVSGVEIELGVIYDPNADELFAARRGHGASLNGEVLPPLTAASLADGLFGLGHSTRVPAEAVVGFMGDLLAAGGMFIRNGSGALVRAAGGWTNDYLTGDALESGNVLAACAPALEGELTALLARLD